MADDLASFDRVIEYIRSLRPADITSYALQFEIMPKIGFGPIPEFLPPSLQACSGQGIWIQQMPNQFAPYLMHLIDKGVSSYLEVGAAHGGSFVLTYEILSKFRPVEASIISMTGKSRFLKHYENKHGAVFDFHALDSHSDEALSIFTRRQWDHVFLDGDHSCNGMIMDFEFAAKTARRAALHDVHNDMCRPGMEAWSAIKSRNEPETIFEFCDQYMEEWPGKRSPGMGIGLVEIR